MVHCDSEKGYENQHLQRTLLVGKGVTKEYSVYVLDNAVDNPGRPLTIIEPSIS